MGENDTAGLDPIFYFHHCFIDRVFWLWQVKHGLTDDLPIIDGYPGTNSADGQGADAGHRAEHVAVDGHPAPAVHEGRRRRRDAPLHRARLPSTSRPSATSTSTGSLEEDHPKLAAGAEEPDARPEDAPSST